MRWILILCLAVGGFFAWQNWPSLSTQAEQLVRQVSAPLTKAGAVAVMKPDGTVDQVSIPISVESWSQRDVCGLRLSLPFELQPIPASMPTQMPTGAQLDVYAGKSLTHEIIITHAAFQTMRPLPLWAFTMTPASADRFGMQMLPKNPATILNGLRAQRTDSVTKASPRVRYRILLLERANQMWILETHTPENDNAFESSFQKIIMSVQSL
ncbi:MAG TPA: hypothetical protein VK961_00750 [Chthoniobacter sp.]|nr:hypothetical protein [Chthoniobacter sp.]